MGCCFSNNESKDEMKPLLDDKHESNGNEDTEPKKSSKLEFTKLEVREFDKVFEDYASVLNPFVKNRENLEQSVKKFKTSVESIQNVRPQASFREYVRTLKTTLKNEGIFIKIKNGAVEVYGVGSRSVKAVQDAVDAIKTIISTSKALEDMPETVTLASGSAVTEAESSCENLEHIIHREFSGVFDCCKIIRFNKNLKSNLKKLKSSPKMVTDFCEEVQSIVEDISNVFDEDRDDDDNDTATGDDHVKKAQESTTIKETSQKEAQKGNTGKKGKDGKQKEEDVKEESKKKEDKKADAKKNDDKQKTEYQKQLKMETVGLADIDKMFTDVTTTLNRFVTNREKLQQARESFEKIMKTLCNFDGEKEFKEYINELKKKAKEGKIHIYIDVTDGEIKLDSVKGVDPPAPYRNAVKALNDVKSAGIATIDLEPDVENGLEACGKDIANIEPMKDFKQMVSGAKELMKLPKKVKAFNENRKKVQKAPQIVKEFLECVKKIIEDISKAFTEDDTEEKDIGNEKQNDGKDEEAAKEKEHGTEVGTEKEPNDDSEKQEDTPTVRFPRKSGEIDDETENKSLAVQG